MKRKLKRIAKELSGIEDVKAVILYGSLARGNLLQGQILTYLSLQQMIRLKKKWRIR